MADLGAVDLDGRSSIERVSDVDLLDSVDGGLCAQLGRQGIKLRDFLAHILKF